MSIKKVRKKSGYSQVDIARKLRVTQSVVSQWESGKVKPRSDKLIKLSQVFDCTVDELLRGG